MHSLEDYGFDAHRHAAALENLQPDQHIGRVVRIERGRHQLITTAGLHWSTWAGRSAHRASVASDYPAVGDWVVARGRQTTRILDRTTALVRRTPGRKSGEQLIATNLHRVLVVTAVGEDFSPRRLERYVALVHHSGAQPIVVLNKTDLPFDVVATMQAIEEAARGAPLCLVSGKDNDLGELAAHLRPRETLALIGSSGVGKSTLLNRLAGHERQTTQNVRASDETGRHTTTRRELVRLPGGALLIDNPGLREVGLVGEADAVDETFDDVARLARQCRYADCSHGEEPGCAVQAALRDGTLSQERWTSHERLRREAEYERRRSDPRLHKDTKSRWKKVHQGLRQRAKIDPKFRR